jgi:hypothetical protein
MKITPMGTQLDYVVANRLIAEGGHDERGSLMPTRYVEVEGRQRYRVTGFKPENPAG